MTRRRQFSIITVAVDDKLMGGLEGFAAISEDLPASVFFEAAEDGEPTDAAHGYFAVWLDLMDDNHTQVGEKCISIAQAAEIMGVPAERIIPMGRQRLAEINDDAAAYIRGHR